MSPVSPDEFDILLRSVLPSDITTLAIAVSGGPDSLALALLAHQWATSHGGKAIALTVDHRLREGSTAEAQQVHTWLTTIGLEHHILTWVGEKPQVAIQATAREARYRLLQTWCQERGIQALLTAHHAQDQLETFLIRLSKGSGLKGLAGIQGIVKKDFGW